MSPGPPPYQIWPPKRPAPRSRHPSRRLLAAAVAVAVLGALAVAWGVSGGAKDGDLNCSDLTWEQAQTVLAEDASDPHDLDRDRDGEACEANR